MLDIELYVLHMYILHVYYLLAANVDKFIKPAPLVDKSLEKHDIFNIPIIIISGELHVELVRAISHVQF